MSNPSSAVEKYSLQIIIMRLDTLLPNNMVSVIPRKKLTKQHPSKYNHVTQVRIYSKQRDLPNVRIVQEIY